MKKKQSEKTSSHLDLNKSSAYFPTYYNGERAQVGDLVKYHNMIDVSRRFDYNIDEELYLLAGISEELVGTRSDTDNPMHTVDNFDWLADIRNNRSSHIISLKYLVKVKGE
jgi:hypothetical protein